MALRLLLAASFVPLARAQAVGEVVDSNSFEDAAVVDGTVCDDEPFNAQHALANADGRPVVTDTGFTTFYADTLCADGTRGLHDCAVGAAIGVVGNGSPRVGPPMTSRDAIDYGPLQAADGTNFYQIIAHGVDGFTYVCFDEKTFDAATDVTASIQIYLAQNGWHEEPDRLRAWVETNTGAVSMLPECVDEVHKHNVDRLELRVSVNQQEWTGAKNQGDDPALIDDGWAWITLTADLGSVTSAKVCAGLQTGAGHEAVWLDDYKLTVAAAGSTATCPMDAVPDYANPPRTGDAVAYFSDYAICCDQGATCTSCDGYACAEGNIAKAEPNSIFCAGDCTADDCCNPTCGDVDDDGDGGSEADDLFTCPTGQELKYAQAPDATPRAPCFYRLCGLLTARRVRVCVCRANPLTVECPTGDCSAADCCQATNAPAPADNSGARRTAAGALAIATAVASALSW